MILGTPWLIKENPDIDWVKPEGEDEAPRTITSFAIVERPRQQ